MAAIVVADGVVVVLVAADSVEVVVEEDLADSAVEALAAVAPLADGRLFIERGTTIHT
jgi:hypothetical protein